MKIVIFLTLIAAATAIPGLSSIQVWLASFQLPITNLIENPYRRSTIPQFILDTRHPWILSNQRKLESLPNAEAFLCYSPSHDSLGKVAVELEVPEGLFENLEIDNTRDGRSRPGWSNALERLGEMNRCPRALAEVRKLYVSIYIHRGEYVDWWMKALEPSEPPKRVVTLFGDVLESMTRLEGLKWGVHLEDAHFFEESFKARNLTLPFVKSLELGWLGQFLVGMCPDLERLESGGGYGYFSGGLDLDALMVESGALVGKLKRFSMAGTHHGWSPSLANDVMKSMPQIESLGLHGSVGGSQLREDNDKFAKILEIFSKLKNLTHIDLPYCSELALGFDGGPECGNAFDGPDGRAYGRDVARQSAETTEKAGSMVLASLPALTSFTIGDSSPNITRAENGTRTAIWPWTGRMDEWVMEIWPENDEFDEIEYGSM